MGDEIEQARGILKLGVYKRFLEEVVPLNVFAEEKYRTLPCQTGRRQPRTRRAGARLIRDGDWSHREITSPHDGLAEAENARLIVSRGYGEAEVHGSGGEIDELRPYVMKTCADKALKDHSDCTLVIVLEVLPLPESMGASRDENLRVLMCDLEKIPFKAKRVRVLVLPDTVVKLAG